MIKFNTLVAKLVLISVLPFFFACSDGLKNDDSMLIINDFKMKKNEFQAMCVDEMEYNTIYKTSMESKQALLACIIKKELLIQEAQRLGIDKDDKFIAAIEKYWESTLIKLLMERKSKEIIDTTLVSEKEIEKRYEAHKATNKTLPDLKDIEKEIGIELLEEKKTKLLESWVDGLHKNAKIKIDTNFLSD